MAKALKCDICGFLYEPYGGVEVEIEAGSTIEFDYITLSCDGKHAAYRHDFDCCPGCANAIKELIEERRG